MILLRHVTNRKFDPSKKTLDQFYNEMRVEIERIGDCDKNDLFLFSLLQGMPKKYQPTVIQCMNESKTHTDAFKVLSS